MEAPTSAEEQHLMLLIKEEECLANNFSTHSKEGLWKTAYLNLLTGEKKGSILLSWNVGHFYQAELTNERLYCHGYWDGILCWPETEAEVTASLPCPAYFAGFNSQRNATRICTKEGKWFQFEGESWTNYSLCGSGSLATVIQPFPVTNITLASQYLPILNVISQTGYGLSLSALIIAFIILASFKYVILIFFSHYLILRRLRCPRNILHMHLFFSFMLRAALSIIKQGVFLYGVAPSSAIEDGQDHYSVDLTNNWSCKIVTTLWQYFILANYSWILMEGLYLHNLIFLALFSDTSSITVYVILGWCLPMLFVLPWVTVRALFENMYCWTTNENRNFYLLLRIPMTLSMLISFGLFLNIVRVLLLKLTATITEEKRRFRYRRWAKSTLVLVPLFGAHYACFNIMSYSGNEHIELVWLFIDQLFASFQGFFVALLYCFMNGEVRAEISKLRNRQRDHNHHSVNERNINLNKFFNNKRYRGSTGESCMTSFISSIPNDLNTRRSTIHKITLEGSMDKPELLISKKCVQ